jgi:hypothetical protein
MSNHVQEEAQDEYEYTQEEETTAAGGTEGLPNGQAGHEDAQDSYSGREMAWRKIEIAFDALDEVTLANVKTLAPGSVVAWKVCFSSCPEG